jgi:hypothetical protein
MGLNVMVRREGLAASPKQVLMDGRLLLLPSGPVVPEQRAKAEQLQDAAPAVVG